MDAPEFHHATRDGWHHIAHLRATNQGHVLWVVIQRDHRFKDSDIDGV